MDTLPDFGSPVWELLHTPPFVSYFDVSAVALYMWDYIITFDMEVDLVWRSKWTFMKCLFLVQRYLPFIDVVFLLLYQTFRPDVTIAQCHHVDEAVGWLMLSGTLLSELLLALRVWAVWDRAKWPTIILSLSFIGLWGSDFYYMNIFLNSMQFASRPYPTFVGCFLIGGRNVMFLCFVTIMIWDIGTLILMLIPGLKAYKSGGNTALFYVIYRDGVAYYLYLVVLSTLNVVAIRSFPPGKNDAFFSMQRCLHTILASRVLLHIRDHVRIKDDDSLFQAVTITTREFQRGLVFENS